MRYAYPEMAPFDYQARWLDDFTTRWLLLESSRQVGKSQTSAYKGVVKGVATPGYRKIFTSYTLEDCREKIEYANDLYDHMLDQPSLRKWLPEKIVARKLEIKFSNGSRLISVFVPRGKSKADVDMDEFPHYPNPRKVYRAATPIMVHGGQLVVMGTTAHSRTMFARMMRREGGQFRKFVRARIYWWDCPIHCRDVARARREAPRMDTASRVRKFGTPALQDLFDNMFLEDFQREFELLESDDELAFLSWELILACTPTGEDESGRCIEVDHAELIADLRRRTTRPLFAGYDVGRKKDRSELSVMELVSGGILEERFALRLDKTPFDVQEQTLRELMSIQRVVRLEIDETGIGMMLAENLHKSFGQRVEGVSFTGGAGGTKAVLASNMRMLMEQNRVRFQADMEKNFQMHSVKKGVTAAGNLVLKVQHGGEDEDDADAHADVFWARALACHAFNNDEALGPPRIGWA